MRLATPEINGRLTLLRAIRFGCSPFWERLNFEVWKREVRLDRWADRAKIVDSWFLQALQDTLDHWTENPDSPEARLDPDSDWFYYSEAYKDSLASPFAPIFDETYLKYQGSLELSELSVRLRNADAQERTALKAANPIESLDDFAKRMMAQFKKQLKQHKNHLRDTYDPNYRPEQTKHAEWTMLIAGGFSPIKISKEWPGMGGSEEHADTISRDVRRFKKRIGLQSLDLRRFYGRTQN